MKNTCLYIFAVDCCSCDFLFAVVVVASSPFLLCILYRAAPFAPPLNAFVCFVLLLKSKNLYGIVVYFDICFKCPL